MYEATEIGPVTSIACAIVFAKGVDHVRAGSEGELGELCSCLIDPWLYPRREGGIAGSWLREDGG
jgi:hypothetical protein